MYFHKEIERQWGPLSQLGSCVLAGEVVSLLVMESFTDFSVKASV